MKKFLLFFALLLVTIFSNGQVITMEYDTTFFRSDKIVKDIKYYNHFWNKYSSNIVHWANGMKSVFPKDENDRLGFTYIFKTNAPIDIDKAKKICTDWYDETFPYCQIFSIDKSDNCIKGKGKYEYLSELQILSGKRVTNHALIDIVIRIKDNRIKFEVIGRQYQYYIEYSGKNKTIINYYMLGSVFPFVEEYKIYNYSETAESYVNSQNVFAESYVKFCNRTILLACSFLDYLNKNLPSYNIQEDDDW